MRKISLFVDDKLSTNSQSLKHMTRRLHNCLPCQLIPHIEIASNSQDSITISASSQATAQKLSYCTREIKRKLGVTRVKIIISNAKMPLSGQKTTKTRRPIGLEGKAALSEAAKTIDHAGLKQVLTRLAQSKPV